MHEVTTNLGLFIFLSALNDQLSIPILTFFKERETIGPELTFLKNQISKEKTVIRNPTARVVLSLDEAYLMKTNLLLNLDIERNLDCKVCYLKGNHFSSGHT
jgi:hypothetical protein